MGFDEPSHWVIVAIAAALLFGGYKKLPEMARSAGRSLRIFKTEMKGMADDDAVRTETAKGSSMVAAVPAVDASSGAAAQVVGAPVASPVVPAPVAVPVVTLPLERAADPSAPPVG